MKLSELLEVCKYSNIRLYSGWCGGMVTSSREKLKKYGDVDILQIYPRMNLSNKNGESVVAVHLHILGDAYQIQEIKRNI